MSRVDDAERFFSDGTSCSQAVFAAFGPSLGMSTAESLRLAAGFGGGMHVGGTCGAATGAVLVLGLRYAGNDSGQERRKVMEAVEAFYTRFLEQVGAADCPAILGCDVRTPEGVALSQEQGLRETRCLPAVRAAAAILDDMLGPAL